MTRATDYYYIPELSEESSLSKTKTWEHGQYIRHKFPRPWVLEAASLFLSISSMVAIIIILARNDGAPINDWPLSISINTLVSVLGVIFRANLGLTVASCLGQQKWNWFRDHRDEIHVFEKIDEASRGAAGSLLAVKCFLEGRRIRSCAILGAFATVAALGTGPMLQATISLEGQLTNTSHIMSNVATIPMAQNVSFGQLLYGSGGMGIGVETPEGMQDIPTVGSIKATPDFGMSSSITEGIYLTSPHSTAKERPVNFHCTTGNCTWPIFSTSAVCSSCNDVTSHIKKRAVRNCSGSGLDDGPSSPDRVQMSGVIFNGLCTSYELRYGHIRQQNGPIHMSDSPVLLTVGMTANFTATMSFKDADTALMTFLIFRVHDDYIYKEKPWEEAMPTATECALHFCAQAYQSSATAGDLSEKVINSWTSREPRSWSFGDSRNPSYILEWSDGLDGWFPTLAPGRDIEGFYRTDLQINIPSDDSDILPPEAPRNFNISQSTILGTQTYIAGLLFGDDGFDRLLHRYNNTLKDILVFPPSGSVIDNQIAPVAGVLWNSTNLTRSFETLARRMTTQLRDASILSVEGTVQEWVFVIRVDWYFLILPTMTMIVGVGYSVFVMIQTRALRMPIWLGSALAVLCYGCNRETQAVLKGLHRDAARDEKKQEEMDGLLVQLVDGPKGYELDALLEGDDGHELRDVSSSRS